MYAYLLIKYIHNEINMQIHAKKAFLNDGWAENVRVTCAQGKIERLEIAVKPNAFDKQTQTLLPAPGNVHSHSFQRAMAGLSEYRVSQTDNFWTWRDLMYQFVQRLNPDHIEAIAAMVFMEMQKVGYAAVGEFHYLHHQADGTVYDRLAETSDRIFSAAQSTGIGLTHLPVLYSYGGLCGKPATSGQKRFFNDTDRFLELLNACNSNLDEMPLDTRVGVAPHSLRAVAPDDLNAVLGSCPSGPIHMHVSEQRTEVEDVTKMLGQRPVAWLLDNTPVDERWCLIHATHMDRKETQELARSGAVVGLCPITEANLGDGTFSGPDYFSKNGQFGIGSDSNIRISLTEELRLLEYSQRLREMKRVVLSKNDMSIGRTLYTGAAQGGALALGRNSGTIKVGKLADLVAIDHDHPTLFGLSEDRLLDGLCFAAGDTVVTDTWCAGRHVVQSGRHIDEDRIVKRYKATIADVTSTL